MIVIYDIKIFNLLFLKHYIVVKLLTIKIIILLINHKIFNLYL